MTDLTVRIFKKIAELEQRDGLASLVDIQLAFPNEPDFTKSLARLFRNENIYEPQPGQLKSLTPPVSAEPPGYIAEDRYSSLPWEKRIPKAIKKDQNGNPLPPNPYYFTPSNPESILYREIQQLIAESGSYKAEKDGFKYFWSRGGLARRPLKPIGGE